MLKVHGEAVKDLRVLRGQMAPRDFARLAEFVDALRKDAELQGRLLQAGYGRDWTESISVEKWGSMLRLGRTIYRVKSYELERDELRFRIFYIFNSRSECFHILGIARRSEFDYDDPDHPLRKRIEGTIQREFLRR